jgi:hypothetical protein
MASFIDIRRVYDRIEDRNIAYLSGIYQNRSCLKQTIQSLVNKHIKEEEITGERIRKNDFRASDSGSIIYNKEEIDERCVKIAFDVNKKLKAQSIAYDFVFDENNEPLIVEISYGYTAPAYDKCEGYWDRDRDMNWHEGTNFDFCGWMVENLIAKQESRLE